MRFLGAALWLLAVAATSVHGEVSSEAPEHRASRDSYVQAYQDHSFQPQKQQIELAHSHSYPVYSAPVPEYGPAKEPYEHKQPEKEWYGVNHYHHHYQMAEPPAHVEEAPDKGHGGFELSTVVSFLAKLIFIKLLIKKIYLVLTLLLLPKIKLLSWLWEKKKKPHRPSKPDKPDHDSSEEHHDQLESDDEDVSINLFSRSARVNRLHRSVQNAIDRQAVLSSASS